MNVHKRCQKNVANNCGINTKMMAEILNEMGISPDKNPRPRPSKVSCYPISIPVSNTPISTNNVTRVQYSNTAIEGAPELASSGECENKDSGDKHDDKGT